MAVDLAKDNQQLSYGIDKRKDDPAECCTLSIAAWEFPVYAHRVGRDFTTLGGPIF